MSIPDNMLPQIRQHPHNTINTTKQTTTQGTHQMKKRQAAATTTQKSTSTTIVRPTRKRQADRLLKQLPLCDRKLQTQIRHQIMNDPIFSGA